MKRQKKINKVYINIGLLVTFFLIAIFLLFIIIFTKGDMTPPIIVDINEELSGVFNNTVIVDDRTRDYFYYKGLNYTDTADGTLPTGSNRGLYKDNQLVDVDLTYYSLDLNSNLNAYVSLSERQDKYVYYKIYPINDNGTSNLNDDYVLIELIENPFTDRPTDKGFNGWTTNYVGAELFHNKDYYIREVKVPVTYTGTTPNKITISFNAVWGPANVSEISNSRNWSTALGSLDSAGMKPLDVLTYVYEDYDMTGYFERVSIGFFSSIAGYYNDYGVLQTSGMCTSWGGCTYYRRIENELFDDSNTYYESTPYMVLVDNSTLPIPKTLTYVNGFTATSNMGSYFKKVLIPRYSSYEGYYDASGGIQGSGTCNTNAGCTYYELINYYDENGNPSIYDEDEDYYYLITRDLNILYMTSNISNAWGNINKPFTLTSLHNGNKRNVTWTVNFALRAYADVNIENLTISSGSNPTTSSPPTGTNSSRDFYGSWNNVRIGRGIERNGNYTSWTAFVGGYSGSTGSASNTTKYRVIIESGYFSTVTIGYTTGSSNSYLEARAIYGNDYDRVQKNNDDLMVHYVAAGSWGGTVRSSSNTAIAFDHIVKSGSFGSSKYNHTTGFYIGGRNQGTYYAARQIKVEGGWIYNAIGGPMSDSSRANHNDVYAYMVGGEVDAFFGGAGTSTTYGNRILQITGGKVNYAVFGGSNSYNGSSSDGQIEGSSFIYIGGNAVIGDPTLVSNNSSIWGAEAGSVFGIGNGRTGSSYTSLGSMRNSNIIITDHATINKNVYGGGNFGALGTSGVSTTTTNMWIYGGTVKGDVYGAGNINGSGATNRLSTINIYTYDGEVEGSLYGGSNEEGIVYGSVNMDILGGTFYGTVYGGGRGGYTNSSNPGTYIRDAINIQVGTESSTPVLLDGLYGGSAYGTVNADNQTASLSSHGINITIDNADVTGSVFGGSKGSSSFSPNTNGHINITVNGGTIPSLFGGNDMSGIVMGNSTIILNGGTIGETYGGGNQVSGNNSYITLNGATTNNIFGGSNQSGDMLSSTINLTSGTNINAYGGNNIGGETATTNVKVVGGNLTNVYGGGKLADTGETNVTLTSGTIPNVYGGGESANIDNETKIVLTSATVGNLFGGSNQSGSVPKSTIDINGGTATNVYGGNNAGGKTTTSLINITNGNITTSYGGGKLADTGKTTTNVSGGTIQSLFGGGEEASIDTNTTLNISGGTITNIYGGSNVDGSVPESNITINGGTTTTLYGGNNMGGTTTESKIVINTGKINKVFGGGNQAETTTSNITLNNNIDVIDYIYGGGNLAEVKTTNVNIHAGKVGYIYGGGNQAGVETTNIDINGGTASYVFGGSNQNGDVETSNITVKNNPIIGEIYGGNNAGGNTDDIYIKTYGGTVNNIYGGGNEADSGTTNLVIKDTYINQEIYGGGKDGKLLGSATTTITDSKILLSVYSGGKGETATVFGNTTINIEGTSIIGEHVFGGGNAALTGSEALNNSTSVVNIAGADIGLNVYGGANTSVVYGTAEVYIGNISGLDNQKITIGGTVFGGGEANAEGSETYDFSFISVTKGINIKIDNTSVNDITIKGSIFGSGNASSTTGASHIYINNYGTESNHSKNISIQRATSVTLNNSYIELFGATDRTNEYSNVLFSLSRIDELILSSSSSLYLETGTNLVKKFTSIVEPINKVKASVIIADGKVTKNVDNRLYAKEGVNINIATNESVTAYGMVSGMTFFGMYIRGGDGNAEEALYNVGYNIGDPVSGGDLYAFSSGSYILGAHALNHNIEIDGFYSNYENEDIEGIIDVKYIDPIPEDSNYYMWVIGEMVSAYDVDLIASKFSTLGSVELPLINTPDPNMTFSIIGVNYLGLPNDFELVDKSEIPRISVDGTSDTKMALTMKNSKTGWMTEGETSFLTAYENPLGTKDYLKENSFTVPSLLFNLYHSKNLAEAGEVGTIVINLVAIKPIDDLNNEVTRLNINVMITKALFTSNEYEGAMTPGEEHENFVSTKTDITDKSKLSAYYSLYIEDTDNIYKAGYHRALVSSFILPENTKITMIDFKSATPTYYYYNVDAQDVIDATAEYSQHNEVSYKLSKFIKMGSTSLNNNYDDAYENTQYYLNGMRIASEEFIFIVDFAETELNSHKLNETLLLEIRDSENQTKIGVLGINYENLTYNIYNDSDALVGITASLSKEEIYLKDSTVLSVETNFSQTVYNGISIQDTTFFNKKLGLKITIFDENDNQLNISSLLGVSFTLKGVKYFPRMDGTTRFTIATKVANVLSKITINTVDSNLPSGTYKIRIESFGSADGIYYGLVSSDVKEVTLNVLNNIYGLKSTLEEKFVTIDKVTGETMKGNNALIFNIEYSSGLANPNLRISLKRRLYDEVHSLEYEAVDFSDYFTHSYASIGDPENYEYFLPSNLAPTQNLFLYLKENLTTGTYKITFSLYDKNSYIGEVYNYIVIR